MRRQINRLRNAPATLTRRSRAVARAAGLGKDPLWQIPGNAFDLARALLVERCGVEEYAVFGWRRLSKEQKATIFLHSDNVALVEGLNWNPTLAASSSLWVLRDKRTLLRRLGENLGREFLDVSDCSRDRQLEFLSRHSAFVAKQPHSAGSFGVKWCELNDPDPGIRLQFAERLISAGYVLWEEPIEQHPSLEAIFPGAVHTLRVHTLKVADKVEIRLSPLLYIACHGARICTRDGDTIVTRVSDEGGLEKFGFRRLGRGREFVRLTRHPDTGVSFEGFEIPFLQEALALAVTAAHLVHEVPWVGWDIAVTPTGPVIIEGNGGSACHPDYQQFSINATGFGEKRQYDDLVRTFVQQGLLDEKSVARVDQALFSIKSPPPTRPTHVIVLGSSSCLYRAQQALDSCEHTRPVYVLSGGNPHRAMFGDGMSTEAEVMRHFLIQQGVSAARIITDHDATNTHENLRRSFAILKNLGVPREAEVVVVTAAFHQRRVGDLLRGTQARFRSVSVLGAQGKYASRANWHQTPTGRDIVLRELIKCGALSEVFEPRAAALIARHYPRTWTNPDKEATALPSNMMSST